ncbi:MAG: hypothetical protein H6607_04845 [Flavobacteriales bacterium]|nr:hypothetical protein [Flavobacteriales bacterium]
MKNLIAVLFLIVWGNVQNSFAQISVQDSLYIEKLYNILGENEPDIELINELDSINKGLKLAEKYANQNLMAVGYHRLGSFYERNNELDRAQIYFSKSFYLSKLQGLWQYRAALIDMILFYKKYDLELFYTYCDEWVQMTDTLDYEASTHIYRLQKIDTVIIGKYDPQINKFLILDTIFKDNDTIHFDYGEDMSWVIFEMVFSGQNSQALKYLKHRYDFHPVQNEWIAGRMPFYWITSNLMYAKNFGEMKKYYMAWHDFIFEYAEDPRSVAERTFEVVLKIQKVDSLYTHSLPLENAMIEAANYFGGIIMQEELLLFWLCHVENFALQDVDLIRMYARLYDLNPYLNKKYKKYSIDCTMRLTEKDETTELNKYLNDVTKDGYGKSKKLAKKLLKKLNKRFE